MIEDAHHYWPNLRKRWPVAHMANHGGGSLILGVDGGGSTTRVAVTDESGHVLATSFGRGVNPMDNEHWQTNLNKAVAPLHRYFDRVVQACFALPAYGEARAVSDR